MPSNAIGIVVYAKSSTLWVMISGRHWSNASQARRTETHDKNLIMLNVLLTLNKHHISLSFILDPSLNITTTRANIVYIVRPETLNPLLSSARLLQSPRNLCTQLTALLLLCRDRNAYMAIYDVYICMFCIGHAMIVRIAVAVISLNLHVFFANRARVNFRTIFLHTDGPETGPCDRHRHRHRHHHHHPRNAH